MGHEKTTLNFLFFNDLFHTRATLEKEDPQWSAFPIDVSYYAFDGRNSKGASTHSQIPQKCVGDTGRAFNSLTDDVMELLRSFPEGNRFNQTKK